MNRTRLVAAALAAGCVGYEWFTLKAQARSGHTRNDTWSEITRDVGHVDTLVGKAVVEFGLPWLADWFRHHLQEGLS